MRNRALHVIVALAAWGLLSSSVAAAPRQPEGDPKRAYGAIDVILYQTSW